MKKVWKGWVAADAGPEDIFEWDRGFPGFQKLELGIYSVEKTKGNQPDWVQKQWFPKRVIITVEVED